MGVGGGRAVTVAIVALVLAVTAVPTAASTAVGTDTAADHLGDRTGAARATVATTDSLVLTIRYSRVPERPGLVAATLTADIPLQVSDLTVGMRQRERVRNVTADGFESERDGTWRWDGETETPSLSYRVAVNQTSKVPDSMGYEAVSTSSWALFPAYFGDVNFAYRYRGNKPVETKRIRLAEDARGYATESIVYLGPAETYDRTAAKQRFTLVVPAAVESYDRNRMLEVESYDRNRTLDALANASRDLRVGARDRNVTAVVGPKPMRDGGSTYGGSGFWAAPRSGPTVAVHEYVHTRQAYRPAVRMQWFDEGSADYYQALLALRSGEWSYWRYRESVTTERDADTVLAESAGNGFVAAHYTKGERVLAALDARIRRETDGDRTLEAVFRRMNRHEGNVSYADFVGMTSDAAGTDMGPWLDRYVRGSAVPDVPEIPHLLAMGGVADQDGDGLDDARERDLGSNPFLVDTDGDGLDDARELKLGTDLTAVDTDSDGLDDARELELGTDPTAADTDGDGLNDSRELELGTDPTVADTDDDGISDSAELDRGLDPTNPDTDGDGVPDDEDPDPSNALEPLGAVEYVLFGIVGVAALVVAGLALGVVLALLSRALSRVTSRPFRPAEWSLRRLLRWLALAGAVGVVAFVGLLFRAAGV